MMTSRRPISVPASPRPLIARAIRRTESNYATQEELVFTCVAFLALLLLASFDVLVRF
jgi:hypothetical protein